MNYKDFKVIVIEEVKYREHPSMSEYITMYKKKPMPDYSKNPMDEHEGAAEIETVRRVVFKRPFMPPVAIAFSSQASEILGLSYDVYENQEKEIRLLNQECTKQLKQISSIKSAGWRQRLKWLFTGVET